MNKVYVLNFNETGIYCAYATKEKAKQVLWECYCDEILPYYSEERRQEFFEEDQKTFEEDAFIIDYGWVQEVDFVNE